jgi:para-aminobenzoate synthetase/4-amino-4-deoxychorismate lyase
VTAATVRLDDISSDRPSSWEFHGPVATGRADQLCDVTFELERAESRASDHGEWVVFVLAYEAAQAFDRAATTAPRPPSGTPFVWWTSFSERRSVARVAPVVTHVVQPQRVANTVPYPAAVRAIKDRIERGDVYQVNMTDRFVGQYVGDPLDVYAGLIGVQSCSHGAYVDMGERVIASASPELFFRVDGDTIRCRPMKGTAPRFARPDQDRAAGSRLAASEKDRAENVMIVDLLRNDLSRVATLGSVTVPALFDLERYETVWQLTSSVTARLDRRVGIVELMRALFPCGSITGAPRFAAMGVIAELEDEPRGVYCGAIGVMAPDGVEPRIECSVPIRTAVIDPATRSFVYGAGGGITWSSDPHAEDDEVRDKARILTRSHRRFRIFETLLLDRCGPRHLDQHLDRMADSADWFGFRFDRVAVAARCAPLRSTTPERLRIVLDPDGSVDVEREQVTDLHSPARLAIDDVVTAAGDPFCCHKTTYRRHYDEARARHPGADDVVLVNELGHAVETTVANLAYRIGSQWFVPPLADGGLPGIARQIELQLGHVVERSIRAADLGSCDELAVINDLRGRRRAVLAG